MMQVRGQINEGQLAIEGGHIIAATEKVPKSNEEAMASANQVDWTRAMHSKLKSLETNVVKERALNYIRHTSASTTLLCRPMRLIGLDSPVANWPKQADDDDSSTAQAKPCQLQCANYECELTGKIQTCESMAPVPGRRWPFGSGLSRRERRHVAEKRPNSRGLQLVVQNGRAYT
ncbi:hypothetical protein ON010_g4023 [Phytophthora cinnamomi]|nr:hypothetical protein ON010_g4023 [Phytophthora cinnamomi]